MAITPDHLIKALYATGLFSADLVLTPLAGGAVNHSYKISCADSTYFLKTFEQTHLISTSRQQAYLWQVQLAKHKIAATPVYLSENQDFQVDAFVHGPSLLGAGMSANEQVRQLAVVLARIHKVPLIAKRLDLPGDWQRYLDKIGADLEPGLKQRLGQGQQIWRDTYQQDQALCHNDLARQHVMLTRPNIVLDWEYGARGNRYFDLAACAIINKLSPAENTLLQQAYSELASVPLSYVKQEVARQSVLVSLTNELWYRAANLSAR